MLASEACAAFLLPSCLSIIAYTTHTTMKRTFDDDDNSDIQDYIDNVLNSYRVYTMKEAIYYVLVIRPSRNKDPFDTIGNYFNCTKWNNNGGDISEYSILVPGCGRDPDYRKGELRKLIMDRVWLAIRRHLPSDYDMTVQDCIDDVVLAWNNDVIDAARKEPVVPPVMGAYALCDVLGVCVNNY